MNFPYVFPKVGTQQSREFVRSLYRTDCRVLIKITKPFIHYGNRTKKEYDKHRRIVTLRLPCEVTVFHCKVTRFHFSLCPRAALINLCYRKSN